MTFGVVFVGLAVFFSGSAFMGAVAEGLVPGESAHADPDGFFLRLDFERLIVGFQDFSHG